MSAKLGDAITALVLSELKASTNEDLASVIREFRTMAAEEQKQAVGEHLARFALARDPREKPFEHPCYWAAFIVHGV